MIVSHQHFDLNGKIVLERVIFQTPFVVNREMQDEACLLYNIRGDSHLYSALDKQILTDNECAIMKCGHYFTTHPAKDQQRNSEVIAVHFYPEILKTAFDGNLPKFFSSPPPPKDNHQISTIQVNAILDNYIQSLLFLFENPTLITDELIALKVKEVILLLLNTNSKEAEKIKTIFSDIFNPVEVSFKEIINKHLFDNLTVEHLAMLCNMSISTFKRQFKKVFDENPATYIRHKRVEKAASMLRSSNESISKISYTVGFSDTSNFTKIFKSQFGRSPKDYRELNS
ncbi:MAG: AraC family transcriptional regulator [Bacteroidota bacterium]